MHSSSAGGGGYNPWPVLYYSSLNLAKSLITVSASSFSSKVYLGVDRSGFVSTLTFRIKFWSHVLTRPSRLSLPGGVQGGTFVCHTRSAVFDELPVSCIGTVAAKGE